MAATSKPLGARRTHQFGETIFSEFTALANEHGAVNLGQGAPDFAPPDFVLRAGRAAMSAPKQQQYARGAGHLPLVEALARVKATWRNGRPSAPALLSYNIGVLSGGEGINCISRRARATFEFRSPDADTLARMDAALAEVVAGLPRTPTLTFSLETIGRRPAAHSTLDENLAQVIQDTFARNGVALVEDARSTNINAPLAAGWRAVCLGLCRCGHTHRTDEYVEIDSLATGWRILRDLTDVLLSLAPTRREGPAG